MFRYGLIGKSLQHSFSPSYFSKKFAEQSINADYQAIELPKLNNIREVIETHHLDGFNITVPFKEDILKYVDTQAEEVKSIGASNCVKLVDGKLLAFNTDFLAFQMSLKNYPDIATAVVLGTGGAAKAVCFALSKLDIDFQIVSRNPKDKMRSYEELEGNQIKADLLVNCTPLGTWPKVEQSPLNDFSCLRNFKLVYDLIYNPNKTKLLQESERAGVQTKNGHEMLVLQAEKSWEIWNNELASL